MNDSTNTTLGKETRYQPVMNQPSVMTERFQRLAAEYRSVGITTKKEWTWTPEAQEQWKRDQRRKEIMDYEQLAQKRAAQSLCAYCGHWVDSTVTVDHSAIERRQACDRCHERIQKAITDVEALLGRQAYRSKRWNCCL